MLIYNDQRIQNDLLKYAKNETKYNTVKSIEDDILKRKSEIERELKTLIKDTNSYYDKAIRPYVSKDLQVDPNGLAGVGALGVVIATRKKKLNR